MSMRGWTLAAAVGLSLLAMTVGSAGAPQAPRADIPGAAAPVPTTPSGDAAAKHAKRTACLKDAKANKLVGAEKAAFLKNCIAAQ